jgi:UbiD family decarboxylase
VEGPFGEFPGTYTGAGRVPVFRVTAVSHRDDPIFENIQLGAGWGELDTLIGINTCVPVLADLRRHFPEVVAVNALSQHGLTCIIAVRNRYGGFAKSVAHRAVGSPHGLQYLKNIILVDEDVDPFDLERVMWSLSTRTRSSDITVLNDMPLIHLDPSAVVPGKGHRLIIDATRPTAPDPVGPTRLIDAPDERQLAPLTAELDRLRERHGRRG